MTSIDTIEDLLRLVREDEEIRAALRREVLTEELLALPAQFIAMQETQASMQETLVALQETQASMQESMVALQETQASMQESMVALQETQNSMLEEMRESRRDIGALHGMFRQQHQDFGRFRGNYAADAARRNRGRSPRFSPDCAVCGIFESECLVMTSGAICSTSTMKP